jgi:hypothetical protein
VRLEGELDLVRRDVLAAAANGVLDPVEEAVDAALVADDAIAKPGSGRPIVAGSNPPTRFEKQRFVSVEA